MEMYQDDKRNNQYKFFLQYMSIYKNSCKVDSILDAQPQARNKDYL